MPAYVSTTPPYALEDILLCNVTDHEGDVTSKSMRVTTYKYSIATDNISIAIVSATDSDGNALTTAADNAVTPVAGPEITTITLDGSASVGAGITYLWEIDIDSGGYEDLSTLQSLTYEATAAGVYTFKLTVTDLLEVSDTDTPVAVTLIAPAAVATALSKTPAAAETIVLDGSSSTGDELTWLWEVSTNDGDFEAIATTEDSSHVAGISSTTYDFRLTVTDSGGITDVATPDQVVVA
jgi:hypothetical protein